jgi:hypothetical protein
MYILTYVGQLLHSAIEDENTDAGTLHSLRWSLFGDGEGARRVGCLVPCLDYLFLRILEFGIVHDDEVRLNRERAGSRGMKGGRQILFSFSFLFLFAFFFRIRLRC